MFTMSHEDLFNNVMFVINLIYTPCTVATRYHVPNMNILQVATTLECIPEQQDAPLVESYNQQ